ncbi:MAG: hypothetical protein ACRCXZ_02575 [Patescibacteria group bacterium]
MIEAENSIVSFELFGIPKNILEFDESKLNDCVPFTQSMLDKANELLQGVELDKLEEEGN